MLHYEKCKWCGLVRFSEEDKCPRCGREKFSCSIDRDHVGFREAIEYAYSNSKDSIFDYQRCVSFVADFTPHLDPTWRTLLFIAFNCGAIDELRTKKGGKSLFLSQDVYSYRRAKEKLFLYVRDDNDIDINDVDMILRAYIHCLSSNNNCSSSQEKPVSAENKKPAVQNPVSCLTQIESSKKQKSHFFELADSSRIENMSYMFAGNSDSEFIDLSTLDTSQTIDMRWMFCDCSSLTALDLSRFNTSKVTDMSFMFYACSSLNCLNLSNFNTSNLLDAKYAFHNCRNLSVVILGEKTTQKFISQLPIPEAKYIDGADGYWHNASGKSYRPFEIPTGVADVYYADKTAIESYVSEQRRFSYNTSSDD